MERSWICVHGLVRESLKVRESAGTCRGKQKHIRHRERMNKKRIRKEPPECFNVYFQSHWSTFIAALLPLRSPK